jgi:nicotinamide phosphoribosyltransferase
MSFAVHKFFESIIMDTDSYKFSHWMQYPKGTTRVWSYIEPRKPNVEIVNFGLQAFIKEYLSEPIRKEDVDFAEKVITAHGCPFNRMGWMHIVGKHKGFLPIQIEALPEGTVFQSKNCQLQIVNTDPDCYWLTSYVETALLRAIWYPSSVATISRNVKKDIMKYWKLTSDAPIETLNFKLHDFGSRGASSRETAMLGGMAHLVNFWGTDTAIALIGVMKYYSGGSAMNFAGPNVGENVVGFSIPASEHSTITSWGKEHEVDAYRNMIEVYGGEGKLYACVSDSYDFRNAVQKLWGKELKDEILEKGGTLVVRPDSGNPIDEILFALKSLWENFGGSVNSKGYKVLNPAVRLIQGDGIDPVMLEDILYHMELNAWSIDNIAFGMGGGLLQKVNRDTFSYAQKACAIELNGEIHEVYKEPKGDGGKISMKGILATHHKDGIWSTDNNSENNELKVVFRNGRLMDYSGFTEIRERAKVNI